MMNVDWAMLKTAVLNLACHRMSEPDTLTHMTFARFADHHPNLEDLCIIADGVERDLAITTTFPMLKRCAITQKEAGRMYHFLSRNGSLLVDLFLPPEMENSDLDELEIYHFSSEALPFPQPSHSTRTRNQLEKTDIWARSDDVREENILFDHTKSPPQL
ncbi:hypothetical protein OC834_003747 [Tilletia horrida]|nr:hypothetical protein OC834_003747 [Tilletia horrida]